MTTREARLTVLVRTRPLYTNQWLVVSSCSCENENRVGSCEIWRVENRVIGRSHLLWSIELLLVHFMPSSILTRCLNRCTSRIRSSPSQLAPSRPLPASSLPLNSLKPACLSNLSYSTLLKQLCRHLMVILR